MKILILNGPNLNLTGKREPDTYGKASFEDLEEMVKSKYPDVELSIFQSNHEGELIDYIQKEGEGFEAMLVNPGGLTHSSVSLADALANLKIPKVEVHLSNIFGREEFRRTSITATYCDAMISGLGMNGYIMALQYLIHKHGKS